MHTLNFETHYCSLQYCDPVALGTQDSASMLVRRNFDKTFPIDSAFNATSTAYTLLSAGNFLIRGSNYQATLPPSCINHMHFLRHGHTAGT